MTKADAGDWKTPLGYYERAIAEIIKTREQFQAEFQNLKQMQASVVEIPKLKTEFEHSQIEIQMLKAELQITKTLLKTTESAANTAQVELQALKQNMKNEPIANSQIIEGLAHLKEQISQVQFQQMLTTEVDDFKIQIIQSLSDLRLQVSKLSDELTLISMSSGTDYTQLRNLLATGEWKKADEETQQLMLRISNRCQEGWLDRGEIERFPWQDFRIINRLWVEYSNGRFGFSVQKQIWQRMQVPKNSNYEVEKTLGDCVGWRVNNNWLNYNDLTFTISAAEGHLPSTLHMLGVEKWTVEDRIRFLFSRRTF